MRRRELLASVAAATAAVAGCAGRADDPRTGTPTDDPGAGPGGPSFGDCPSFVEGVDRTVCYADRGSAPAVLRPDGTEFADYDADDEVQTLTFTLDNGGDATVRLNPYDWAVYRLAEGEWVRVAPDAVVEPLTDVPPGETHEWRLSAEPHPSPVGEDATEVVVEGLESGHRHVFRVHGQVGDAHVEWVARFEHVRATP